MYMKNLISLAAIILFAFSIAPAQKTNDAIAAQIKSLKAEKSITLSYDASSNASKIFARADNFSDAEAKRAGIQAMNFGMAYIYVGKALAAPPETFDFAFWVLSKNPRFASERAWTVTLTGETLDLGDARYGAKPREDMEYLNFHVSRDDLGRIAASPSVKFHLGGYDFTFTASQLTIFKNLITITDTH